jgi:hypothetical protein
VGDADCVHRQNSAPLTAPNVDLDQHSTGGMTVAAGVSTGRANFGRRNYTFVYVATRALRRVPRVMAAQPLRSSDPP